MCSERAQIFRYVVKSEAAAYEACGWTMVRPDFHFWASLMEWQGPEPIVEPSQGEEPNERE